MFGQFKFHSFLNEYYTCRYNGHCFQLHWHQLYHDYGTVLHDTHNHNDPICLWIVHDMNAVHALLMQICLIVPLNVLVLFHVFRDANDLLNGYDDTIYFQFLRKTTTILNGLKLIEF